MIQDTQGQDTNITNKPEIKWSKYLLLGSSAIAIGWLSLPSLAQWQSGLVSIERQQLSTASVVRGDLVRDIAVSGKLVAANAPFVYSPEKGQVTLVVKPGDNVKAQDIIARIHSPELASQIKQQTSVLESLKVAASRGRLTDDEAQLDLERSLDTARVRLNADKREHQRAVISFDKQVISELDFAKRKDALLEADLLYQHALKRVTLTKKRLSFENQTRMYAISSQAIVLEELQRRHDTLTIRAPVTGIVGNALVGQKELVSAAQALMSVVDLSQYEAQFNVPEFYADDLGIGLVVKMTLAGKEIQGKVISISPEVNNNQVPIKVSVEVGTEVKLRQNQRLNARIEFEKKDNVLMVKRGAFLKSGAGKYAFTLEGNIASRRTINTGSASVEYIELLSGVKEGDTLIVSDYTDFNQAEQFQLVN
jgi:HlyD family secretion protein